MIFASHGRHRPLAPAVPAGFPPPLHVDGATADGLPGTVTNFWLVEPKDGSLTGRPLLPIRAKGGASCTRAPLRLRTYARV